MVNESNIAEDESISDLIDDSFTENDSDGISISMNATDNARYARLKIRECIKQMQSEWRLAELSVKNMGKVSHKLFKAIVN